MQTVQGEWHQWEGYLESWTPPYGAFALKASVLSPSYTGDDHREIRYSVAVVSIWLVGWVPCIRLGPQDEWR